MTDIRARIGLALVLLLCATRAQASVEISSAPTQNMNCSAGVCTPTSKSAVLNVNDLTAMLSSADIAVKSGNSAVTIGIVSPLAWATTHRLTLDASLNVNIKAQVMVEGTAGLTIVTNDGGTGGDLIFYPGGKIDFWDTSSSLTINGNGYTLVNDIASLAKHVANHRSGLYALANDYDASADGMYSDFPVATKFSGTFEGLGHTISNLNVSPVGPASAALFVEAAGTLRDVGLHDVQVGSGAGSAGSLLLLADGATIIGCDTTGTVLGGESGAAGGLVGYSSDAGVTIIRSHSAASVNGASGVAGGLIGSSPVANISLSYAAGRANARTAGGLVGEMFGGSILSSYASGHVSGEDHGGGLVGQMYATAISQSFATGEVTAYNAGGLVGVGNGSIQDSYAKGGVRSFKHGSYGGLLGQADNLIVHSSYSIGHVKFKSKTTPGGFVGIASGGGDFEWDYWDVDTSGTTQGYGRCKDESCAAIEGLATSQFLSALPDGFSRKIWAQNASINHGYPYLIANPPQ